MFERTFIWLALNVFQQVVKRCVIQFLFYFSIVLYDDASDILYVNLCLIL